jgi:miniconductance mechanosensitive channel
MNLEKMQQFLDYLQTHSLPAFFICLLLLLIFIYLSHIIVEHLLYRAIRMASPRLPTFIREVIVDQKFFRRLALFVPAQVAYHGIPLLPTLAPNLVSFLQKMTLIWLIIIGLQVISYVLARVDSIYRLYPVAKSRPIKGYLQIFVIALHILGLILGISVLADKSPLVFLSGIGALTAVILLVFRDTLLSLVAGIQLTTNNLIQVGDWIEMPQFEADGDVIDIALHVVKVQNWDRTITVIPTHKFLEHSFKNWRGMQESGGRRIKRSIFVDMTSIRFLNEAEVEQYAGFVLLKDYLTRKKQELAEYNRIHVTDHTTIANARRLTNVGTFRAYVIEYLKHHPQIHQGMTFLVRQLQPTPEGLPIEIYVFVNDVRWAIYEGVQADVFDHILAITSAFGLRVYQRPSSHDLQNSAINLKLPVLADESI